MITFLQVRLAEHYNFVIAIIADHFSEIGWQLDTRIELGIVYLVSCEAALVLLSVFAKQCLKILSSALRLPQMASSQLHGRELDIRVKECCERSTFIAGYDIL